MQSDSELEQVLMRYVCEHLVEMRVKEEVSNYSHWGPPAL